MRLASVSHEGAQWVATIEDGRAYPVGSLRELGPAASMSEVASMSVNRDRGIPTSEVRFRPLVPNPRRIVCVGLNYVAHAAESDRDVPTYPVLFTKFASTLTGAFDDIPCPAESNAIDYEGELVVVIGERTRRISPAAALSAVWGVSVANDVSMRDFQNKTHQWLQGKAWDGATPVGPELVTLDEIPSLDDLTLRTLVNGEVVQEASTAAMIFDIPTLVSTISVFTELEPGDLILTGTPSGVGFRREPQILLAPGDVSVVEVPGVCRLQNQFIAENISA